MSEVSLSQLKARIASVCKSTGRPLTAVEQDAQRLSNRCIRLHNWRLSNLANPLRRQHGTPFSGSCC